MNELSLLRHFVAVAETGSFTAAASRLNIAQSAVSRSLQRLEDQLGTSLVSRTTRSLSLTPAGSALLNDGRAVLDRLAVAADNARRIGQGTGAELRIGICETVDPRTVVRGIAAHRAQWPDVRLRFQVLRSDRQPEALRTSAIDVGLMQGGVDGDGFASRLLARFRLIVALPVSWGIPAGRRLRLSELRERPWLLPDPQLAGPMRADLMAMFRRAGFAPQVAGTVDHPLTARLMVACGMGATFFHDNAIVSDAEGIRLHPFHDAQVTPPAETHVTWSEAASAPQLRAFVDCLSATAPDTAESPSLE